MDRTVSPSVPHTRMRLRDVTAEAFATIRSNALRSSLSAIAVTVGAASLVSIVMISDTSRATVSDEFNEIMATTVRATGSETVPPDGEIFPIDAEERLKTIPGVVAGGIVAAGPRVRVGSALAFDEAVAPLVGADLGVIAASESSVDVSRLRSSFLVGSDSALVGEDLARRLGVRSADLGGSPQIVLVNGGAVRVLGVLRSPRRISELADSIIMPLRSAERFVDYDSADLQLVVQTLPGATQQVAKAISPTLAPERVDPYVVDTAADPTRFRRSIERSVQVLVLAMAALAAVVGAISIASTTYGNVNERLGEFGVRRSLGAQPKHLRRQVLVEAAASASVAGVIGTLLGSAVGIVYARLGSVIPVVNPTLTIVPLGCVILGAAAGWLPAVHAGRIDPAEALRRS